MRAWLTINRTLVLLNSAVVITLTIGWSSYARYGHRLVGEMYKRKSIGILNSVIDGQSIHPLTHYLQAADTVMWVISLLVVTLSVILTVLLVQLHRRGERLSQSWGVLFAVGALLVIYGPFLLAHIRNSANPLLFNDDARAWVVPFVVPGFASEYSFTLLPVGYTELYQVFALVADPITISKVLPYLLLLLVFVGVCAAANRLGGSAAALSTAALCLSTGLFLDHMAGGNPRAFGFPLLAAAAAALVFGRTLWLAAIVVASAAFYPPMAVVAGLALAIETLAFPLRHMGEARQWSLRRRIVLVAATALSTVLFLAPGLMENGFGPRITVNDVVAYPEAGPGGRYSDGNVAPFDDFWTELRRATRVTLTGAGRPLSQKLRDLAHGWEDWLHLAVLTVTVLGLAVLAWQNSAAARLLILGAAAVVSHMAALLFAPHFYLAPRYVTYPIPILIVVGMPIVAAALPRISRRVATLPWAKPLATFAITGICLLVFGGRGDERRGLTVDLRQNSHIFEFLGGLPHATLVAGWPWDNRNIDSVPYLARRQAFLTFETHQAFHRGYLDEMRCRMRVLLDAMFAIDSAPLVRLRDEWGVTHLIVDRRHYGSSPPTHFKPFDVWTRDALDRGGYVGFEVPRQLNVATVFSNGDLAVLDLRRIAAQVSSTGTPRTPDGGLARDGNTAGPPASCRAQTNEGDAQLTNRPTLNP